MAPASENNNRIIVRNLPKTFTTEQVSALFSEWPIDDTFVSENKRLSGKFAFVTFKAPESASAAIAKFNGHVIADQGREGGLSVEIASSSPSDKAAAGGGKKPTTTTNRGREGGAAASASSGAPSSDDGEKNKKNKKKSASAAAGGGDSSSFGAHRGRGNSSSPPSDAPPEPSTRVIIRNLPKNFTTEQLREILEKVGPLKSECFVSANKRLSGRFAFADFADIATATRAIESLNGKVMDDQGRPGGIVIQYARAGQAAASTDAGGLGGEKKKQQSGAAAAGAGGNKKSAPAASSGAGGNKGNTNKGSKKETEGGAAAASSEPAPPAPRLFINNLPATFTVEALKELMGQAGKVTDECFVSSNKRLSGRFGFVVFESVEQATKALNKFNGMELEGQGRAGGLGVQYARVGQGNPPAAEGGASASAGGNKGSNNNNKSRNTPRRNSTGNNRGQRGRKSSASGEGGAAASSEPPAPNPRVFVSNLPRSFESANVVEHFSKTGKIDGEVFVSANRRLNGKFAFVKFSSTDEASKAISTFNGLVLPDQGREGGLVVQYAKPQE